MKKNAIVTAIIVLALALGFVLYKISPQATPAIAVSFDLSGVKPLEKPGDVRSEDHILGNPDAKNTLVAYEDLQCPFCASYEPTLKSLPSVLQDTKVVFRHFPLMEIHRNAAIAALSTEAASAQGKFWEYATKLYEKQDDWSELSNPVEKFAEYAAEVGVANIEQFKNDVSSQKYKERVQRDLVEGYGISVPGTPSLYMNGKRLEVGTAEQVKAQAEPLYLK